jgi:uncharacterized protein (DUF1499 family)
MLTLLLIIVAGVIGYIVLPGGAQRLDSLLKVPPFQAVDFATLRKTPKPNQFVVLPANVGVQVPDSVALVYPVDADALKAAWTRMIAQQAHVSLQTTSSDGMQIDYVQRTPTVRFPDLVTVRFYALDGDRSTLAIYSRSVYGQSDLGVNAKRISGWLAALTIK